MGLVSTISTAAASLKSITKSSTGVVKNANPSQLFSYRRNRTDRRVSLTVNPINGSNKPDLYINRVKYVLGDESFNKTGHQTLYGFLNKTLSGSAGLIFPYTPTIGISHSVNYETTEVLHSNITTSQYKNTPPPTITISDATFTADTRENALQMLSALWFLRACTKCDFGELAGSLAGMPPPILYLNGYNATMSNIPVIITGFSYSLPKDKDYVSIGINLDSNNEHLISNRVVYSDVTSGNFYDNIQGNIKYPKVSGVSYLRGALTSMSSIQTEAQQLESNLYNDYYFESWLPTTMTFSISLSIQPNLDKVQKQFSLKDYKNGWYNLGIDEPSQPASVKTIAAGKKSSSTDDDSWKSKFTSGFSEGLGDAIDTFKEKTAGIVKQKSKKGKAENSGKDAPARKVTYIGSGWTW